MFTNWPINEWGNHIIYHLSWDIFESRRGTTNDCGWTTGVNRVYPKQNKMHNHFTIESSGIIVDDYFWKSGDLNFQESASC